MFDPSNNLRTIVESGEDNVVVVEFHADDAAPPFDPAAALLRCAPISGLTVFGESYERLVTGYGRATRSASPEKNTFAVTLDNLGGEPAAFELSAGGFEGKIMVVRLVSRSMTSTTADALHFWCGRCLKPAEGSKREMRIEAEQVWGNLNLTIPRRKYTPEDREGRSSTDPLFEGFRFLPQSGTTVYPRRKKYLFGLFKKTVQMRQQWSSFSDLDSSKSLPVAFGRVQILGTHLGYADVGNNIQCNTAWTEGKIKKYLRIYSTDYRFTNTGATYRRYGYLPDGGPGPTVADLQQPVPVSWIANGYYSRTAWTASEWFGTAIDQTDEAPDVAATILATIVTVPDAVGAWAAEEWTDNPAAVLRYLLTGPDYENLDEAWLDDDAFLTAYRFNDELLFDSSFSDLIWVPTGFQASNVTSAGLSRPTGSLTTNYLLWLKGEAEIEDVFTAAAITDETDYTINPDDIPEPPIPVPGTSPDINLSTFLRRRYTFNGVATEEQPLWDWINEALLPASRMFVTQGFDGKIKPRHKKPADYAIGTTAAIAGDGSLAADDVSPWIADKRGWLLVRPYSASSEIRAVTGAAYPLSQNSVTLTAGANFTVAGFAGCDGAAVPATATVTVDSVLTGAGTPNEVTVDGELISVIATASDTKETVAGFFSGAVNAHPRLRRKFRAEWTPGDDFFALTAKFGTLTLDRVLEKAHPGPLSNPVAAPTLTAVAGGSLAAGVYKVAYAYENTNGRTLISGVGSVTLTANQKINVSAITPLPAGADRAVWYVSPVEDSSKLRYHSANDGSAFTVTALPKLHDGLPNDANRTGSELLRVEHVLTDRVLSAAGNVPANVLRSTYRFVLGRKADSKNVVKMSFRDATQDFRLVELTLRDKEHIATVRKENPLEIDGSGIDSFHQAYRITSGVLAEVRDADFFYRCESDRRSLFLEEADVVAVTDGGAAIVNLPAIVEAIEYDGLLGGFPTAAFTLRKYTSTLYDDSVVEREIPVFQRFEEDAAALIETVTAANIAFTDGDTLKRVTVSDANVKATSRIVATVRRPDIEDGADPGHVYAFTIVKIADGSFDVLVRALDAEDNPPNETVELFYFLA